MNKKNMFVILGMIVIVLIGIIAYFTMVKKTTSWQTYRNDKYGFELKYPNGWTERQPLNGDTTITYLFSSEEARGDSVYIWIASHDKLPSNFSGLEVKYTEQKIGAYRVFKTGDIPSRSETLSYFIKKEKGGYIEIGLTPSNEEYVNILDKIISTFKFK